MGNEVILAVFFYLNGGIKVTNVIVPLRKVTQTRMVIKKVTL